MNFLITDKDRELIAILRTNARASVSDLARVLNLSRSTVQNRLNKLESSGVIRGYVLEFGEKYENSLVSAHVSIKVRQKLMVKTNAQLRKISQIAELYEISGEYDCIAVVRADNLAKLNDTLVRIGNLDGVERTNSSVILETKFKR